MGFREINIKSVVGKNTFDSIRFFRFVIVFMTLFLFVPNITWSNDYSKTLGNNHRADMKIFSISGSPKISSVIDGWSRMEAESCDSLSPVSLKSNDGVLSYQADKPWTLYENIDLHATTGYIQIRVANGGKSSALQLLADNVLADTLIIPNTGSWEFFRTMTFKLKAPLSGVKNIKFVFTNGRLNVDWFEFLSTAPSRFRVVISTDFPPLDVCMSGCAADHTSDPDDVQSMVRFLLYANEFDVEGLIASSGTFANIANKKNILDILTLYDKVDENLRIHDSRYPTADYLYSVTYQGYSGTWGGTVNNDIGENKDSEASEAIIRIIDNPDPRPVWFCFWGDCSNLAQAIWKVQHTRSPEELDAFLSKIRVFQIAHQDNAIDWLLDSFPNLFIIYSKTTYAGIFGGSVDPIGNLSWLNTNIRQDHGPLGSIYPPAAMGVDGLKEGDSPSFMYLVSAAHGMNDAENPAQESWGGQYVQVANTKHWIDGPGTSSISKWKSQYQTEFAKRADWMLLPTPVENNRKNQLSIFPNPAKDNITVVYETGFNDIKLVNNCGKVVYEAKFNKTNSVTLPTSSFKSGLYIVEIIGHNTTVSSKIIIRQNNDN